MDETADQRQFYGQLTKLLTRGRSMDSFRCTELFFQLFSQNCWPWQFYGHFSASLANCRPWAGLWTVFGLWNHVNKTADHGSFMDTFRCCQKVSIKLLTMAVLWTHSFENIACSQNCWPWQFYGQIYQYDRFSHNWWLLVETKLNDNLNWVVIFILTL